ncbi:pheophytinase, chloroplastic [Selaginella moellendorffii]|uniref:pheophytinase, chloroplastic n=1 Tax=Selaginella moellendorffii TaxID=88036 RepID=UPI000D1C438C|nr:pheophytinase, chloroplastic [Selaginella moellendorffii]|eukprot:XP_024518304.1 pheophytinase, chloroplastic [Selaginella moellendorffii]
MAATPPGSGSGGGASELQTRMKSPPAVETSFWQWRDYNIRYQRAGAAGPALVLIHGFGANCDHWRKNIPVLAERHRVYAIDLLGYGYSDKPSPRQAQPGNFYTFELWASQVLDFCSDVVQDEVFLVCNSVGGIVGLEAALTRPASVKGLQLINISLRLLHIKKQARFARPFIKAFQELLRQTAVGKAFFKSVTTPETVKKILCECYHDDSAVTDELVEIILRPGLESGAADVFLDFIGYSGGPLPEEMLPRVQCPVSILWGEKDPWEPVLLGQAYRNYETVEEFIVLPNAGHCPQDETPELVNELVEKFVSRHDHSSQAA